MMRIIMKMIVSQLSLFFGPTESQNMMDNTEVEIIEIGSCETGRRVKVRTHTYTGVMEGWISVVSTSGMPKLRPSMTPAAPPTSKAKPAPKPPPVKRERDAGQPATDDMPSYRRRWY